MGKLCTLQSRLARKQDLLRRKLIDNQLRLIGNISDCIRMTARQTYEGDNISWIVQSADVIQVVFPPLRDIPFRKIKRSKDQMSWELSSLIGAFEDDMQNTAYTVQIPYNFNINVGDLIFRIFLDDDQEFPIIVCIQVKELLGTFGGGQLIMQKMKCTIPTDNFPPKIVETIHQMAERRLKIRY